MKISTLWLQRTLAGMLIFVFTMAAARGGGDDEQEARRKRAEKYARVDKYPERPWDDAFVFEGKSYRVRTNTSETVANYIGELMDYAQKNYREIFGFEGEIPMLDVHAYRTDFEYLKHSGGPEWSGGLYSWKSDGTSIIHVKYSERYKGTMQPTETLLHEGTHQFVHMALYFRLPEKLRPKFNNQVTTMQSVPKWLNEGMATYMEVSYYDGKRLVVGEINRDRLRALRRLLRNDEQRPLPELFRITDIDDYADRGYEMGWGITYWFLHDSNRKVQKKKRKILKEYIEACSRGFMKNPEKDFEKIFIAGRDNWGADFWDRWNEWIREKSFETLVDLTVGKPERFPEWEEQWKEWVLDLNNNDPYGGLYD